MTGTSPSLRGDSTGGSGLAPDAAAILRVLDASGAASIDNLTEQVYGKDRSRTPTGRLRYAYDVAMSDAVSALCHSGQVVRVRMLRGEVLYMTPADARTLLAEVAEGIRYAATRRAGGGGQ